MSLKRNIMLTKKNNQPGISFYLQNRKKIIDQQLERYFPPSSDDDTKLRESIRYGLFSGGKRLRPILCLAASEAVCGDYNLALPVACSIELIHTYSLIHDDLPSMDNDMLRRGKPTNHNIYGEALAILTGDALLTEAFGLIAREGKSAGLDSKVIVDIVELLSYAAGHEGMVLGQSLDLYLEGNAKADAETIKNMHRLKTGAMIEAAVLLGATVARANDRQLESLRLYSGYLGLSFQIIDDVLDVVGSNHFGKQTGSDSRKSKSTFPSVLGLDESRKLASSLTENAVKSLDVFEGDTKLLRDIAYYLGDREH